ncbi:cadherin-4 isoform X1 [Arapaima gigas]
MTAGLVMVSVLSTALLSASWGNYGDVPSKPPCRPGFSESFYTVLVSRDILQGQSILKEGCCVLFGTVLHHSQLNPGMVLRPVANSEGLAYTAECSSERLLSDRSRRDAG